MHRTATQVAGDDIWVGRDRGSLSVARGIGGEMEDRRLGRGAELMERRKIPPGWGFVGDPNHAGVFTLE